MYKRRYRTMSHDCLRAPDTLDETNRFYVRESAALALLIEIPVRLGSDVIP